MAIDELVSLLNNTVKTQMIADVGVGVFLSGGIDSSTVAAIAQSKSNIRVKTFSIGFGEKEYDESRHAKNIADYLGTDHSTIQVTSNDTLDIAPELPSIYDEPFAYSSQIPMYIVSKFARSKITVCLSGDGGDELFAGYNRYLSTDALWEKINSIPFPLRKALGKGLAMPSPGLWDGLYDNILKISGNDQEKHILIGLKVQKLAGLMQHRDLMNGYDYLLSYWSKPEANVSLENTTNEEYLCPELPATDSFINKAMYLDQNEYLPGDNLAKVNRASMAVSL